MFQKFTILASISVAAMGLPGVARACSVCFSGDDDALTHAFNWSVGFLLAAPYVIAGTIAGCLVIAYRSAVARQAAEEQSAQAAMDALIWTREENAK
jgi:hypothetical protein